VRLGNRLRAHIRIVGAPPPRLASTKTEPTPLAAPLLSLPVLFLRPPMHEEAATAEPNITGIRRPHLRMDHRPRAFPVLVFPYSENPLASLYLPVPLISFFMASSALAACARKLWPPAMASAALAHSSDRRDGLGEFPSSPAFSRCLRISEPWPVGL